jgi:hypothetical protein
LDPQSPVYGSHTDTSLLVSPFHDSDVPVFDFNSPGEVVVELDLSLHDLDVNAPSISNSGGRRDDYRTG